MLAAMEKETDENRSPAPFDIPAGMDLYMMTVNVSGAPGRGAGGTEVEVSTSGEFLPPLAFEAAGACPTNLS